MSSAKKEADPRAGNGATEVKVKEGGTSTEKRGKSRRLAGACHLVERSKKRHTINKTLSLTEETGKRIPQK